MNAVEKSKWGGSDRIWGVGIAIVERVHMKRLSNIIDMIAMRKEAIEMSGRKAGIRNMAKTLK